MGRHSVPDDEGDEDLPRAPQARAATQEGDVADGADTAAGGPGTPPAVAPRPGAAEPPRRRSGTAADLDLLRHDRSLRARTAAAAIVPMLLYVIVLLVMRRFDVFLIWLWVPVVAAGVLVGAFLDRAHAVRSRGAAGDDRR